MNIVAAGIAVVWVLWIIFCLYLDAKDDFDNCAIWLVGGVAAPLILMCFASLVYIVVDGLMEVL